MSVQTLAPLIGVWEQTVNLPGAEDVRGTVTLEAMGEIVVERSVVPHPQAPDSQCVIVSNPEGGFVQHYFDSRGVARLYDMTFDGRTWTLERTREDFTPLEFSQRYVGELSDDGSTIAGEWQTGSADGSWVRDFGLTYRRISKVGEPA